MVDVANHFLSDVDEVRFKLLPKLCQFVALFPEDNQKMLLHTLIRERLESETGTKSDKLKVELLEQLFSTSYEVTFLVDNEFHKYLYTAITTDQVSSFKDILVLTCLICVVVEDWKQKAAIGSVW